VRALPVRSRSNSAVAIAPYRWMPAMKSAIAGPDFTGGASGYPVVSITPVIACTVKSIAG
jgi:hypothetical protein